MGEVHKHLHLRNPNFS